MGALAALIMLGVPGSAFAVPGDVVTSFGGSGDGVLRYGFDNPDEPIHNSVFSSTNDGHLFVANMFGGNQTRINDFDVSGSGAVNATFGGSGQAVQSAAPTPTNFRSAMTMSQDGKPILAILDNAVVGQYSVRLRQFNPDGSPDVAFNGINDASVASATFNEPIEFPTIPDVAVSPVDGTIVVAVNSFNGNNNANPSVRPQFFKFAPDGSLLNQITVNMTGQAQGVTTLAIDSQNRVVFGGKMYTDATTRNAYVGRLTAGFNALDTSFSTDGWDPTNGSWDGIVSLAVGPGDDVYGVGQYLTAGLGIIRFNAANGAITWSVRRDPVGGQLNFPSSIALDSLGHVYVGLAWATGLTNPGTYWTVARFLAADGSRDPDFAADQAGDPAPDFANNGATVNPGTRLVETACHTNNYGDRTVAEVNVDSNDDVYLSGRCFDGSSFFQTSVMKIQGGNPAGPVLDNVNLIVDDNGFREPGKQAVQPANFPGQALTAGNAAAKLQTLAFRSGAFRSGAFRSGAFRSGAFRSGAFRSGAFRSGAFRSGAFRSGPFQVGAFRSGAFRSGAFRSGAFRSGDIASSIPLSSIPLSDPTGANPELSWGWVLEGTQYEGKPMESISLQDVFDLRETENPPQPFADRFDGLYLDEADIAQTPLPRLSLSGILLGGVPLAHIDPPAGYASWCDALDAQVDGEDQPYKCGTGNFDLNRTQLGDLEFHGDDLTVLLSSPIELKPTTLLDAEHGDYVALIARFGLATVALNQTPLADLRVTDLADAGLIQCPTGGPDRGFCDDTDLTVGDLYTDAEYSDDLDSIFRLRDSDYEDSTTVADLVFALYDPQSPLHGAPNAPDTVSLSDLIPGVIAPEAYDIEDLSDVGLGALLEEADYASDTKSLPVSVTFDVDCDQVSDVLVRFHAPSGFRYKPDSAEIDQDGSSRFIGEPTKAGNTVTFESNSICHGGDTGVRPYVVSTEWDPDTTLGLAATLFSVDVITPLETDSDTADISAGQVDIADPHDDASLAATEIETDNVYTGHIASDQDRDYYKVLIPEGTPVGSQITFSVSHMPSDDDLVIFGPDAGVPVLAFRSGAFRSGAFRSGAFRSGAFRSGGSAQDTSAAGSEEQQPNVLQDVPLPEIPDNTVRAMSIHRGLEVESATVIVGEGDQGKSFTAQVTGFNGASSPQPYVLRATASSPAPAPSCAQRPAGLNNGPAMQWPAAIPSTTQSLYLVNDQRLRNLYPDADISALLVKLQQVAAASGGVVIPVESDPRAAENEKLDVHGAFEAWDQNPCSAASADGVVAHINAVVDDVRTTHDLTDLRNIVIVGGDDVIPQGRQPDLTVGPNEQGHADEVTLVDEAGNVFDSSVSRALREGNILTDDSYGSFHPQLSFGSQVYVPEVGLGRLVESPAQITGQLQQFLDSNGVLSPQSASVSGYDFFGDGSQKEADALKQFLGDEHVTTAISDGPANAWTASTATAMLNTTTPSILVPNAHYTQDALQPAANFYGTSPNTVSVGDIHPAAGQIVFTMGCHAGLPMPYGPDWPELYGASKDVYVASTGYGLGDTDMTAYTERLLRYFAENIGPDQNLGQALMFAKQRYVAEGSLLGSIPALDGKTLQQTTFYGLPTYKVGVAGTSAPSVVQPEPEAPPANPTTETEPFTLDNIDHDEVAAPSGNGSFDVVSHPSGDEDPIAAAPYPIVPATRIDVTDEDGVPTHGAVITELDSTDDPDFDPVYDQALATAGGVHPPEPIVRSTFFPSALVSVADQLTIQGRRDKLTLATGQFFTDDHTLDGTGTMRLFTKVGGELKRSLSSDYMPVTIRDINATTVGTQVTFSASTDDDDATRADVLYRVKDDPTWYHLLIDQPDGTHEFQTTITLPHGATEVPEYNVQMMDTSGNVAVSTKKGPGYQAVAGAVGGGRIAAVVSAASSHGGVYNSDVTVTLDDGGVPGPFTYEVSGAAMGAGEYTAPLTFDGQGTYVVVFRQANGPQTATVSFTIDKVAPTITGQVDPPLGEDNWTNRDSVHISFACADDISGVESCGPDVDVTPNEGVSNVFGTAVDTAGNVSSPVLVPVKVDRTAPGINAVVINADGLVLPGEDDWYRGPGINVRFQCTDDRSGIRSGDGCSDDWAIPDDTSGYTATGVAFDKAGNQTLGDPKTVKVDSTLPSISADVRDANGTVVAPGTGGWYHGSGLKVHFTCSDALSGLRTADGCPADVPISDTSGQTVTGTAHDKAGNARSTSTTVKVDNAGPTVTARVVDAGGTTLTASVDGGWYRGTGLKVRFTCTDAASGVVTCPGDVALGANVLQPVSASATDGAGNTSTFSSTFKVDTGAPTITGILNGAAPNTGWYTSPSVSVGTACTDPAVNGVASGVTGCPAVTAITEDGVDVMRTAGTADRAGNTGSMTLHVKHDHVAPTGQITSPSQSGVQVGAAANTISGIAGDATSGVATVVVNYRKTLTNQVTSVNATLNCNATRTSCTWSAPEPTSLLASYDVTVVITDNAGLRAATPSGTTIQVLIGNIVRFDLTNLIAIPLL